jgi:hypothetical protein
MKIFKIIFFSLFLVFATVNLSALDMMNLFRHSEIANKNAVFIDVGPAPFLFDDFNFNFLPLNIRLDYMLPLPLPFSLGGFINTPYPNLKSFGGRFAYHFDLLDRFTDLYFLYSFDLGFLRNDILEEHNDTPVEIRYYDFRVGIRRFFGRWFGITVETGFKFESIIFLLSIKLN